MSGFENDPGVNPTVERVMLIDDIRRTLNDKASIAAWYATKDGLLVGLQGVVQPDEDDPYAQLNYFFLAAHLTSSGSYMAGICLNGPVIQAYELSANKAEWPHLSSRDAFHDILLRRELEKAKFDEKGSEVFMGTICKPSWYSERWAAALGYSF